MEKQQIWFSGIDWASKEHRVTLLDADGAKIDQHSFAHDGAGLAAMADWLVASSGGPPQAIHVAIEVTHGPIVETLLERGFTVYGVNPKQLDRFRDRFTLAGAKDDSRDSEVLADALRTDRHRLRPLAVGDPLVIELREWSRIADEVGIERNRLVNRLREQFWRYYPAIIGLAGGDLGAEWILELWETAPTPDTARRVRQTTIAKLLKRHRIRRVDAAQVVDALRQRPLAVAPGTIAAATAHIRILMARLRLVNRQLKDAHAQLDCLLERVAAAQGDALGQSGGQLDDVTILMSWPGLGTIIAAKLLGEGWEPLQRRAYQALRCLCGTAPVTKRSGKSYQVVRRYACHPRLREAAYHLARGSIQHDARSRAKYQALRDRGHSHARALRSVADRLLAVLCAMLENRTRYNPSWPSVQVPPAVVTAGAERRGCGREAVQVA